MGYVIIIATVVLIAIAMLLKWLNEPYENMVKNNNDYFKERAMENRKMRAQQMDDLEESIKNFTLHELILKVFKEEMAAKEPEPHKPITLLLEHKIE